MVFPSLGKSTSIHYLYRQAGLESQVQELSTIVKNLPSQPSPPLSLYAERAKTALVHNSDASKLEKTLIPGSIGIDPLSVFREVSADGSLMSRDQNQHISATEKGAAGVCCRGLRPDRLPKTRSGTGNRTPVYGLRIRRPGR